MGFRIIFIAYYETPTKGFEMDDVNINLLETIHKYTSKAEQHREYLQALMDNPVTPPAMRKKFAEMYVTLGLLSHMLRTLNEHNMEMGDALEKLVNKVENL